MVRISAGRRTRSGHGLCELMADPLSEEWEGKSGCNANYEQGERERESLGRKSNFLGVGRCLLINRAKTNVFTILRTCSLSRGPPEPDSANHRFPPPGRFYFAETCRAFIL